MFPRSRVVSGAVDIRALAVRDACPSSLTPPAIGRRSLPRGGDGCGRERADGRERDFGYLPVVDGRGLAIAQLAGLDFLHQAVERATAGKASRLGFWHVKCGLFEQPGVEILCADDQFQQVLVLDHALFPQFVGHGRGYRLAQVGPGRLARIELHGPGLDQPRKHTVALGQIEQPAVEPARAVVGHAHLEGGLDLLAILELILKTDLTSRDFLAVDQNGQFDVSGLDRAGWITESGGLGPACHVL